MSTKEPTTFMTNEDILLNALEKARRAGFDASEIRQAFERAPVLPDGTNLVVHALSKNPLSVIFQITFLKAFFGDWKVEKGHHRIIGMSWELHARQMVTKEEPLKYLEKFLQEPISPSEGQIGQL